MSRSQPPETCPVCGAEVPPKSVVCPECGADERTGWSEEARAQQLGLPDESFDYAEFVARELDGRPPQRRRGRLWWWVAVVSLAAFLWAVLSGLF